MAKVKLTKDAKSNLFDNCDFVNVDFENGGQGNKVKDSRFDSESRVTQAAWYSKWWIQIAVAIIVGVVVAGIVYWLGWN